MLKSEEKHAADVALIQSQMKRQTALTRFALKVAKPSNTLHDKNYNRKANKLDLSSLTQVCSIDVDEMIAKVEPGVSMRFLCETTLKQGLLPLVVPEFTSITVGGAIMGAAIESSSHHYGQFNDSCLEYELLLGDGSLLKVNCKQHEDLFNALPGSFGTFGILTLATIRLRKALPYVRITYQPLQRKELLDFFSSSKEFDFIEAVMFEENRGLGMRGVLSDFSPEIPLLKQKNYASKWYYAHLLDVAKRENHVELMPIKDYLFRFDRGAFWMGRFLLDKRHLLPVLFHFQLEKIAHLIVKKSPKINPSLFFHLLFGWAFSSKFLYGLFHRVPKEIMENLFFIHDFYTPTTSFNTVLKDFIDETHLYPIWLCPVAPAAQKQFLSPHYDPSGIKQFINIGLYGRPKSSKTIPELTSILEKKIVERGGRKMLYSHTYYSPQQFSKIYEGKLYEELREKYGASDRFPSLYEKVCSCL